MAAERKNETLQQRYQHATRTLNVSEDAEQKAEAEKTLADIGELAITPDQPEQNTFRAYARLFLGEELTAEDKNLLYEKYSALDPETLYLIGRNHKKQYEQSTYDTIGNPINSLNYFFDDGEEYSTQKRTADELHQFTAEKLTQATHAGHRDAYYLLGELHIQHAKLLRERRYFDITGNDPGLLEEASHLREQALQSFKIAAKKNHPKAHYQLGCYYHRTNTSRALSHFIQSARNGYTPAVKEITKLTPKTLEGLKITHEIFKRIACVQSHSQEMRQALANAYKELAQQHHSTLRNIFGREQTDSTNYAAKMRTANPSASQLESALPFEILCFQNIGEEKLPSDTIEHIASFLMDVEGKHKLFESLKTHKQQPSEEEKRTAETASLLTSSSHSDAITREREQHTRKCLVM